MSSTVLSGRLRPEATKSYQWGYHWTAHWKCPWNIQLVCPSVLFFHFNRKILSIYFGDNGSNHSLSSIRGFASIDATDSSAHVAEQLVLCWFRLFSSSCRTKQKHCQVLRPEPRACKGSKFGWLPHLKAFLAGGLVPCLHQETPNPVWLWLVYTSIPSSWWKHKPYLKVEAYHIIVVSTDPPGFFRCFLSVQNPMDKIKQS